jgi:hypothetical protein
MPKRYIPRFKNGKTDFDANNQWVNEGRILKGGYFRGRLDGKIPAKIPKFKNRF